MRIKEIELSGFKSFVEKIRLNIKPGITALVGPNGCGKSNIIDAMRWIMGEHNARHLRGSKMEDLIFNGSETRKPLGMAEVSLVMSNGNGNGNGNGSSGLLHEIMVTRRLFRSGESEYLINKIPCRLKDIVELFLDSGVGTKSYSIMEQGKVDFILSLKPDERRILIEEAAGISKYRSRKKEALSKMSSTKNNLLRLKDVLNELHIQMRGLELQVKRLKRHRKIREEIKEIDLLLASSRMRELSARHEQHEKSLAQYRHEEQSITQQQKNAEAVLEETKTNVLELHKKIAQLEQNCFAAREAINKEENSIHLKENEIENIHENADKNRKNLADLEKEMIGVDNAVAAKSDDIRILAEKISSLQHTVESAYQDLSASKNKITAIQDSIEKEKSELFTLAHEKTENKNAISLNRMLQDEITVKLQKLTKDKETCRHNLSEHETNSRQLQQQIDEHTRDRREIQETIEELSIQMEDLSESLQKKNTDLAEIKDSIGTVRARLHTLQDLQKNFEGFDDGVRTIMQHSAEDEKSTLSGIIGLFADTIETNPQYEPAVEAVLEKKLQSVIVDSHDHCIAAIDYLKSTKAGRVAFIPKNLKKNTPPHTASQNHALTTLSSIIQVKHGYENLTEMLLGDTLLVDSISQALTLWNNGHAHNTFVTKIGEVVEPTGVISGGTTNGPHSGILKRNREIKEFVASLEQYEKQYRDLTARIETLTHELTSRKHHYDTLVKEKQNLDNTLFQLKTNIEQTEKELHKERERLDVLMYEENENSASLSQHQHELEGLLANETKHTLKEEEKQLFLHELQTTEKQLKDILAQSESKHTELRVNLASSEKEHESLVNHLDMLKSQKKSGGEKIVVLQQDITTLTSRTESISREIVTSRQRLQNLIEQRRVLDVQIEDEQNSSHDLDESVRLKEESIKNLRARWDEIEPEIHALELKINEATIHLDHLGEEVFEKYTITAENLPDLPDDESFSEEESRERLEKLKKRLENIGDVNLGAAKEFEDLDKRYQFLIAQEEDLNKSIESLQKVIVKINRITKQKFLETFNTINNHFKELFPILFNGGKAYMMLTDESDLLETGIEIFSQPPGKKLQSLALLSGGERALTVIAIMFAIFLTKPSPFCLLDEIDAPLDDNNIDRFLTHLKKMTEHSQFIMVTHNKLSMQAADSLYGVTMEERGVSKIVSVELN